MTIDKQVACKKGNDKYYTTDIGILKIYTQNINNRSCTNS